MSVLPPDRQFPPPTRRRVAVLAASVVAAGTLLAGPATAGPTSPADQAADRAAAKTGVAPGWPKASNTGPRGHLREIRGRTITRDGAVLENVRITGQVRIEADNVTLRNVAITSRDYYGVLVYGKDAVIRRALVVGTPVDTLAGIAAYERGSVHVIRSEVRGAEDGVRLNDHSSLRDSFVHGLGGTSRSHYDAVTADGMVGWRIVHNTILNRHPQTAAVWIGDSRYGPSAGLLRHNYLAGGGYTIYSGHGTGPGLRVLDNRFSTRFHRKGGTFGIVYDWIGARNEWSGNTWADGPRKGRIVRPW